MATVCRRWQDAFERQNFKTVVLDISRFSSFRSICRGRRRRCLRQVHFIPRDQRPLPRALGCWEGEDERKFRDDEFSAQISSLFSFLQLWESDNRNETHGSTELHVEVQRFPQWTRGACEHRKCRSWRLHLRNAERLPQLSSFTGLKVTSGMHTPLDFTVPLALMSRLPNLKSLTCNIYDFYHRYMEVGLENRLRLMYQGPRRDSRHAFGDAIKGGTFKIPKSLQHVNFDSIGYDPDHEPRDQRDSPLNLVSPSFYDPFSNGLRILSLNMRTLRVRGLLDTTIFWPAPPLNPGRDPRPEPPSWPELEDLDVEFELTRPAGSWYFAATCSDANARPYARPIAPLDYPPSNTTREDREDDEAWNTNDWEWQMRNQALITWGRDAGLEGVQRGSMLPAVVFRVAPWEKHILPMLSAFARAAARMPSLKRAWLHASVREQAQDKSQWFGVGTGRMLDWGVRYEAPPAHTTTRRLTWYVGEWRPPAEMRALFRRIGAATGREVLEVFDDPPVQPDLIQQRYTNL